MTLQQHTHRVVDDGDQAGLPCSAVLPDELGAHAVDAQKLPAIEQVLHQMRLVRCERTRLLKVYLVANAGTEHLFRLVTNLILLDGRSAII